MSHMDQVSPYHMLPGVELAQNCRLGCWVCLDSIHHLHPLANCYAGTVPYGPGTDSSRVSSPQRELIK